MLTPYRRHRSSCKHRSRRAKSCFCPIWIQGVLDGRAVRQSLDLTSWEAAQRKIRDLEIHGTANDMSVEEAAGRWIADGEARGLRPSTLRKQRERKRELSDAFKGRSVRSVSVEDLRKLRETWTCANSSAGLRLEILRNFFWFCVVSGWCASNPAKLIKAPRIVQRPTLPFSDEEWEKILWALGVFEESHPNRKKKTALQLKALVFVMRYSGIRISDAVGLRRERIDDRGRLFLYQAKTGHPVRVPLPKIVLKALRDCDEGQACYLWNQTGTLKTCVTEWQWRLSKLFEIAGIEGAHSHRFRDSFSVGLLDSGASLQTVSLLLGHTSIRTT
jgi:integrase/recombinase XerD